MSLCERCQAEIANPRQILPQPWFNHDGHRIADQHVTPQLWQILEILWRRRGLIVARESFMALLYGHMPDAPDDHMVIVSICHLRRLLRPTPFVIKTERHRGYRLIEWEAQ